MFVIIIDMFCLGTGRCMFHTDIIRCDIKLLFCFWDFRLVSFEDDEPTSAYLLDMNRTCGCQQDGLECAGQARRTRWGA